MSERVTQAEVPEGAIVTGEIGLVFYMDADGAERYSSVLGVGGLTSTIVGQLEVVKHAYLLQGAAPE